MGERLRRHRRSIVLSVLGLALAVAAAFAATYTPLFAAAHVRVSGERRLTGAEVAALAGVHEGTNVFHLDVAAAVARLETSPWIASATVERDLPSTVRIRVVERQPVAISPGGEVIASDATALPGAPTASLPRIEGVLDQLSPSDLAGAAAALGAMPPVVRARVASVTVGTDHSMTVRLDDGVQVDYGTAGQDVAKGEALRAVLRWASAGSHDVATIDVSVPAAPTATLSGGGTLAP
ncbi:MAG: cell division protein FtsQ/DivIB [Planctomycetaceae bacterium]